jgi:phage terminase small subunit
MALTIAERQARYRAKHKKPRRQAVTHNARNAQSVTGETERKLPLAHMLDVMNDETAAPARRDRMAVAAAAYVHPRVPDVVGKKDAKQAAAAAASAGRFAPGAPPKLVIVKNSSGPGKRTS